jgi:hypothetical protein
VGNATKLGTPAFGGFGTVAGVGLWPFAAEGGQATKPTMTSTS